MLTQRALGSCHEETLDIKGSPSEPAPAQHAFLGQCLEAAALAAPEGSSISAKAWASYADWLFAQHTQCGDVQAWSEVQSAPPPAGQGSTGQATDDRTARDHQEPTIMEAHNVKLEALQAYCTSLEGAGQSVGQSGSSEDHVAALLRVLQVSLMETWLHREQQEVDCSCQCKTGAKQLRCVWPRHGRLHSQAPASLMLNGCFWLFFLQVQADLLSVTQDTDNAINRALARVPMSLWHAVTPQLFTYLEHPKVCSTLHIVNVHKPAHV